MASSSPVPRKSVALKGASSLKEMATRAIKRNLSNLDDVGDMPFFLIEDILGAIKVPAQLARIEDKSPHIKESTEPFWRNFIHRYIENAKDAGKSGLEPRERYYYLLEQQERTKEVQKQALKASMDRQRAEKVSQSAFTASKIERISDEQHWRRREAARGVTGRGSRRFAPALAAPRPPPTPAPANTNSFLARRKADKLKAEQEKAAFLAKKKYSPPAASPPTPKPATTTAAKPSSSAAAGSRTSTTLTNRPAARPAAASASPAAARTATTTTTTTTTTSETRKRTAASAGFAESPADKRARLSRERLLLAKQGRK